MTLRTPAPHVGLLVALEAALLLPAYTPWAGTGAVRPGSGYIIATNPLNDRRRDPQYTVNDFRLYIIGAGSGGKQMTERLHVAPRTQQGADRQGDWQRDARETSPKTRLL